MVMLISFETLSCVVDIDVVLFKLLKDLHINGGRIETDLRAWDL